MRSILALAPLALALVLPFVGQEPEDEPAPGFGAVLEAERARVEKEIEGTWVLMDFQPVDLVFDASNVRGFAMFRDGYLSLNIMAQTFVPEFLGDGVQLRVQGGAHRYRINEFAELQTAAVFAYQNFDDDDVLVVEPSGLPREYKVELSEDAASMTLIATTGARHTWSRMTETEFPAESLEALEAGRNR